MGKESEKCAVVFKVKVQARMAITIRYYGGQIKVSKLSR